jgi:diguanylate cyclase (GGDEF)-like protein
MALPERIRILMVEDVATDAELEVRELKRAGLAVEHRLVDTEPAFQSMLGQFDPHVIISDFSMPHFDGMAALALAREIAPDIPFIFVSGTIGEEYAIRALKSGATDYVLKTNLVRLPAAIERALQDARDRRARREAEAKLARLARIRDVLGAVNAACMRVRERKALFEEFCRIAVARGGFVLARVLELDRAGKLSIAATTEDAPGAFVKVLEEYNLDPERAGSLLAQAVRSKQLTVSNDMRNDQRVEIRGQLTEQSNYSLVILPVRVEGAVVAVAQLRAREPNFFDQEELALLSELVANVEFALELQAKQEKVNYLALYDPLTSLPNRTLFQDRLTQAIDAARRSSSMLSLTVFDLERFKSINDTYGQQVGDAVLRAIAQRLREAVGDVNRVARLGGNQFAVMRPDIQDAPDAARLLEDKFHAVFSARIAVEGREITITAKAGIALFPEDGADAGALFRNAEASLKRAKETGDRFLFYAPNINARVAEQVDLENRLRRAVEKRELFLHFQPKVSMEASQIVGVEALMRWRGPDNLLMSPAKFVPVLEETGMILEAGRQALELAAATYRDWKAQGLRAPRIAVNVSALQLRQKSFVADVRAALGDGDSGVDLEVTESLLMEDIEESIRKLRQLREAGASISLDDFGTGHSSLAYLSRLPIDLLKIDRSFVRGMTENADHTSIVSTIISLAQALRLKTVAEGVETEEQARLLRLLRCDQMQGYLFSPPVAKDKLEQMLGAAKS